MIGKTKSTYMELNCCLSSEGNIMALTVLQFKPSLKIVRYDLFRLFNAIPYINSNLYLSFCRRVLSYLSSQVSNSMAAVEF